MLSIPFFLGLRLHTFDFHNPERGKACMPRHNQSPERQNRGARPWSRWTLVLFVALHLPGGPSLIFCSVRSAHRPFPSTSHGHLDLPLPSGATNGAIHRCHWKSRRFDLLTLHALEERAFGRLRQSHRDPKTRAEVGAGFQSV